jgi:signal transduction histidine kinase
MTMPTSPERLAAVLHAAQYLSNLSPKQDPWAELAQALKDFFRCDLVLIVRAGQDGEPRLVHAFTPGIPAAGILAQARDEARAVLETGFLGSQTLAEPPFALAFLPLPRDRRTAALAIVGQAGAEPYAKEDLEILLALGGLFGNVVARVETERELRDYQQNLEGLVARRTEELEGSNASLLREISERKRAEEERRKFEERAVQAQKLEALGVLVAGVAHNINNALAIIMGTASLREQIVTSPPDREAYQSIGKACLRGRDVVKSLIHFAQPTLSSQAPFELHGLVKEVAALMDSTSRNRIQAVEAFAPGPGRRPRLPRALPAVHDGAAGGRRCRREVPHDPDAQEGRRAAGEDLCRGRGGHRKPRFRRTAGPHHPGPEHARPDRDPDLGPDPRPASAHADPHLLGAAGHRSLGLLQAAPGGRHLETLHLGRDLVEAGANV